MAPANPAMGPDKRRSGKSGAYDPRFVQRGEKINPQSKENFSSSFLIRGVVILNVASGITCEFVRGQFELLFVCYLQQGLYIFCIHLFYWGLYTS